MTFGKLLNPIFRLKKVHWKRSVHEIRNIVRSASLFRRSSWITFIPSWSIIYVAACKTNKNIPASEECIKIIKKADELYEEMQYKKIYDLLYEEKHCENDEILWRLARATYELALSTKLDQERVSLINEAYSYIKRAVEINDNSNNVHRWCAILLDLVSKEIGTKERITKSKEVRKHIEKAIELCPSDSTALYMLGNWCYTFADLSWYQRQLASVIFTAPPTSTFQEALPYFLKAEEIDPNFFSMNLLYIGKTYLKLNEKEKAVAALEKVQNFSLKTREDHQAYKEAIELLKSLK